MRKSGAAFMVARRRTVSSEYVTPVGLEYFGTQNMPLMESSEATRRSTSSMSGPVSVMRTGTFSMPRSCVRPKWRS